MSFFGDMFDLNGDGKLDLTEQAFGFAILSEMMDGMEKKSFSDIDGEDKAVDDDDNE